MPLRYPPAVIIDAADFPTIRATLDALPESGGFVRLLADTFDLSPESKVTLSDDLID
jgi:hypothetical protein